MEALIIGFFSAMSVIILFIKITGLRNTIRFQIVADLLVFIGLKVLFFGTLNGMTIAVIGGICATVLLTIMSFVYKTIHD